MGLFSSKKKTYVSSVLYNMAGPEEDRPQFLKSLILGSMVGNPNFNVVDTLQRGYFSGGGMKLRQFYNWAETNFPEVDIPNDTISTVKELSISEVESAIGAVVDGTVQVSWVETGSVDPTYWAMKWMYENLPDRVHEDWSADFDYAYDEDPNQRQIVISFEDGETLPILVSINGFFRGSNYLYALYRQDTGKSVGPLVIGATVDLGADGEFPSPTGWRAVSEQQTPRTAVLVRKVSTVVDGQTTVTQTDETVSFNEYVAMRTQTKYMGLVDGRRFNKTEYLRLHQTYVVQKQTTVEGNVTTEQDVLVRSRDYRIDTEEVTLNTFGPDRIFIYQFGVGGELDHLLRRTQTGDGYFPLIPLRIDNKFIGPNNHTALYEKSKKAYKKAFGGKLDDLIDKIADNPSVGEIDFAYVVFGASLNTNENACKKYIYNYFYRMSRLSGSYPSNTGGWETRYSEYTSGRDQFTNWVHQQEVIAGDGGEIGGGGGGGMPSTPGFSAPPGSNARIKTSNKVINFDMEIDWESVTETTGVGVGQPGMKPGEVVIAPLGFELAEFFDLFRNNREALERNELKIWWQLTENSWKCLTIIGLVHKNHIWNGKSVELTSGDAFVQEDEEAGESGFLIPLHAEIFKEMSLVDATQMSTACTFLVFNCYQVVKKKWYQRGWFKVFLVIAAIVITVVTGGAGAGAGVGLLGANAAVGAAIGLTGLAAVIAGAVANMIAAMILTRLITYVSVELLGEKIGMIVAMVASFVALNVGSAMQAGQSMASMWGNLLSAQNLIQLTSSVGNGLASYIQAGAAEYGQRTQELLSDYERQSKELQERYAQNVGYANSIIDPFRLTEAGQVQMESPGSFLGRTLMTGSDIADLSMDMLTNFADLTLRLDLPPN